MTDENKSDDRPDVESEFTDAAADEAATSADAGAEAVDSDETGADETGTDEVDGEAAESRERAAKSGPSRPNASTLAWAVAAVIAVVGLLFGAFGVYSAVKSYSAAPVASVRDSVLEAAQIAVVNVTSIDPKDPEKFKQNAASSLTGNALQQVSGQGYQDLLSRKDSPGRTQSRVVRSAVTELDADAKTGKALIVIETVAKVPGQPDVPQPMTFSVSVKQADGRYKADSIVPLSGIELGPQGANPVGGQQGSPRPGTAPQNGGN